MPTQINDRLTSWASDIDDGTIRQAEMASRLPILAGPVALMPDAHLGRGATVGSVIATENAVIPSAVGVDLGCVDMDSEVLTPRGWVRIVDYVNQSSHGFIMQFDPDTMTPSWVEPSRVIKRKSDGFFHLKTKYGIDQMLSPDHKVLSYKTTGRDRRREMCVLSARDLVADHNSKVLGTPHGFLTTFGAIPHTNGLDWTDDQIRLQVAINADGHIEVSDSGRSKIIIKLKKVRKIERLKHLLDITHPDVYTISEGSDGCVTFRFGAVINYKPKTYAHFWGCSQKQLEVIVDECFWWDGNVDDRVFFTGDKDFADFIQYAMCAAGYRAVLREDPPRYEGYKPEYRVFAHDNTYVGLKGFPKSSIDRVASPDGFEYCVTVPTGFWVMRRNGQVVITGNCGMIANLTELTASDLPDDLTGFLPQVERVIPAGVGNGHKESTKYADTWFNAHGFAPGCDHGLSKTALTQFGSLGSGNHFFEICLDEQDRVWIVLHSGSRGVGNQLAQVHIKKCSKHFRDWYQGDFQLEDRELAWFIQGTPEFDAYIADMLWAQDYAYGNRHAMMSAAIKQLSNFMGRPINVDWSINCHHNFCIQETHDGRDMWVTRKGAIKADVKDYGVIPGSMGTRSYIIRGRGNPLSYTSCSHGAGRRHSRTAAKKLFTVEDFAEQMSGKVWQSNRAAQLLDEIPSSYKDIDQVMADQDDLVQVEAVLHQIFNYKGA